VTTSTDLTAIVWDAAEFLAPAHGQPVPLSRADMTHLWEQLAGEAARAYNPAIPTLVAADDQAVAWLREHLHAAVPVDRPRLERLLLDLDSDRFEVRARAAREIEQCGELAAPVLVQALAGRPSAEVRRRLEQLVHKCQWNSSPERVRASRSVMVLERIGTPAAREALSALAAGAAEAQLTREARMSLQRLARRSP